MYRVFKIDLYVYNRVNLSNITSRFMGIGIIGIISWMAWIYIVSLILTKIGINPYTLLVTYVVNALFFLIIEVAYDLYRLRICRILPGPCKDAVYVVNGTSNLGQAIIGAVLRIPRVIFVSEDIFNDPTDYKAVLAHEEHHIKWSFIDVLIIAIAGAAFMAPFNYAVALLNFYHHVINVINKYVIMFLLYASFVAFFSIGIITPMLRETLADLAAYYSVGRAPSVLLRRKAVMDVSRFSERFKELMQRVRARHGKLAMALLTLAYPLAYLGLSLISGVHPDFRRFVASRNPFSLLPPWLWHYLPRQYRVRFLYHWRFRSLALGSSPYSPTRQTLFIRPRLFISLLLFLHLVP